MIYRRRTKSDVWHFVENCSWWPSTNYKQQYKKPTTGELCNECLAKAKRK